MGTRTSEQPFGQIEADFGFGPITIHYRKVNWRERTAIREAHRKSDDHFYLENLILRSRDESGMRIWAKPEDREMIEREFDPLEMDRVVNLMYAKKDEPGN